ncbi:MAG: acyl-CoA dehydrogenase [Gammaproteobacteria bacterium]|nr:acyl-CoA dehydrogenase [Gammaproteobacteria bacterium]
MASLLLSRRDVEFLLYEWLQVEKLTAHERYSSHTRETLDAALDVYETLAAEQFAPHNKKNDQQEPEWDGERVCVNPEIAAAVESFCKTGLIAATQTYALGGMQLPYVVERAGMAYMFAANVSSIGYCFLTMANANLLFAHGTTEQIRQYAHPMMAGRFFGTMVLSEPQAGSSLADINTRAQRQADGTFRLFGNKMWISAGDHELSENIIHLVLAKIPDEHGALASGVRGISLFIVPKKLLNPDGTVGERNDVAVAGLNHKMGYRGITNCALNFGEGRYRPAGRAGAIGFILGEAGRGLEYMFHMMNEARIGIGLGAAALGYTGYLHSLEYARARKQGRLPGERGTAAQPVPIIQHADVRRMLLAQKSYVEGALALTLYCAKLIDEQQSAPAPEARRAAGMLLDLLTPVTKSWPSQWCLLANDYAIQVHGGYGYTRDYNVEQFYRDNRLNAIHEGTHGIQAQDLLGRKVQLHSGEALRLLLRKVFKVTADARAHSSLTDFAVGLESTWLRIESVTLSLATVSDMNRRLANASAYLEAFGHAVVGWIWLWQAVIAQRATSAAPTERDRAFYAGKLQACRYFFNWELPRIEVWLKVLDPVETTCLDMADEWF